MLRTITMTSTAICLSLGSNLAFADHDRELRYVVGGAILGAALGELAYSTSHRPAHGFAYVDYGYRRGHAYPPPRFYHRGRAFHRHWAPGHRFRHAHGRGHRHGPRCY